MGAFGTELYSDDYACDVRGDYIHRLKLGKTNEEATKELVTMNKEVMGDREEEPIFWFALADTQWDYGRLQDFVRNKALYFLQQTGDLQRWSDSGEKQLNNWKEMRKKLKNKLLSPQPKEKVVSSYRLYKCKWQLGDVYAYKFSGDYSEKNGDLNKYIVIRKVSEDEWWPGHVIPVITVFWWKGYDIPSLDILKNTPLLPQKFWPIAYDSNPNLEKEYKAKIIVSSERMIPKSSLTFLGNIPGDDLIPYKGHGFYHSYDCYEWRSFEQKILEQYYAWEKTNQN